MRRNTKHRVRGERVTEVERGGVLKGQLISPVRRGGIMPTS